MAGPSHSSPPSSSSTTAPPPSSSKLSKFLTRQQRDRSKSAAGVQGAPPSSLTNPPPSTPQPATNSKHTVVRKSSKLFGLKEKEDKAQPPTIIEPPVVTSASPSRSRFASTSEPRPMSTVSDSGSYNGGYSSSSSRFSDLPSRLSGWISHTFTGSSTDLSLPSILSQSQLQTAAAAVSPKSKAVGLLTAARHGKDKAMRYLLDSDAQPDKSTDPIWLMGVLHPGYEPPPSVAPASPSTPPPTRRESIDSKRSPPSRRSSSSSSHSYSTLNTPPSTSSIKHSPSWPAAFYSDFTSRIWLTYRSHYAPIRDTALSSLDTDSEASQLNSSQSKRWNWPGTGEKAWTADTGWGCMLRTGQSMLANALIHLHLSRDWRRPLHPSYTEEYATYVKILTWFFDSPSPHCPFSVHRMALAGKELGKDVGQWFGPSTAAGAIKRLVYRFPEAQLAVSVAMDGVIYDSDVYTASHFDDGSRKRRSRWGNRAVLVLVGIRLGIDGVNPIYYEGLKILFTFPQSVGIAGGRPSSSYYFVGTQGDSLFYLDPHHTRQAIPFRHPPEEDDAHLPVKKKTTNSSPDVTQRQRAQRSSPVPSRTRSPTSPSHHTLSPSPLSHEYLSPREEAVSVEDPVLDHYVNAYPPAELRTFHCERVRKMPLSGLDPSMLLGFLCKDETDYQDFRNRMAALCRDYKPIFSIQAEPPSWGDGSDDVGLESFSEPDAEHDQDDMDEDASFSSSPSPIPPSTEDSSSIDPITPGPSAASASARLHPPEEFDPDVIIEDDDDEWLAPTPSAETPQIVNISVSKDNRSGSVYAKAGKGSTYKTIAPGQHFPFPSSDNGDELNQREPSRTRERGESKPMPHIRPMRARDGGRTQSGGVKGVYLDSGDEL